MDLFALDPADWPDSSEGPAGEVEPEAPNEERLRRPGWSVWKWVKMGDGELWALPVMGYLEYLAAPEIGRATSEYKAATAADAELPPNPNFPFALASLRLNDLIWAIAPRMLAFNYDLPPDRWGFLLPAGDDFLTFSSLVIDLLVETYQPQGFPVGWYAHDTVLFDN